MREERIIFTSYLLKLANFYFIEVLEVILV